MNFLGIDIGGTFIKYGVVDENINPLTDNKLDTADSSNELIRQTLKIIDEQKQAYRIQAVGIGVPGFISKKERIIKKSPNMLFLNGIHFENEIRNRCDIPVFVENDANLAAFGVFFLLKDPKPKSFIHLTLGTGVGSGIVLNGEIWQGECGFGAELGHMIVNPQGRKCGCGGIGCIETEASAKGIVNTYNEFSGKKSENEDISALDIFELYRSKEENSLKTFQRAGYFLGIFLCSVANFMNPAVISIGGGVAAAGDALMKPAYEVLQARLNQYTLACTNIMVSPEKSETGVVGSAYFSARRLECGDIAPAREAACTKI